MQTSPYKCPTQHFPHIVSPKESHTREQPAKMHMAHPATSNNAKPAVGGKLARLNNRKRKSLISGVPSGSQAQHEPTAPDQST